MTDARTEPTHSFDVAVVGAGPAGLIAGLACASQGLATAVIGPPSDPNDGRTAALFDGSLALLERLGLWSALAPVSEPLKAMRLVDGTNALVRAPEVTFDSSEIGLEAFGYNVPIGALTRIVDELAQARLTRIVSRGVAEVAIGPDAVSLTTAEGQALRASLAAAADGRGSKTRAAAGIETKTWAYDQSALITTFDHTRPHANVSTEFHRRAGPLVLVPGPGKVTSIVWVERPDEATRLAALPEAEFTAELLGQLQGLLGAISNLQPRRVFPLSGQSAVNMGLNRVALIGEAGHVIPPIGAQGLNLSLRDAATLAELAGAAKAGGRDVGANTVLEAYDQARQGDITSRVWTIDLLNKTLISPYLPVHFARGFGLFALKSVGPLRRHVMREGVTPQSATPSLMRRDHGPVDSHHAALDGGARRRA